MDRIAMQVKTTNRGLNKKEGCGENEPETLMLEQNEMRE